jgi:hypothetical protein
MAAAEVVQDLFDRESIHESNYENTVFRILTFTCLGASADGVIPDTAVETDKNRELLGWYLLKMESYPGSPGPTAASNVYLKNAGGLDLLSGNGVGQLANATPGEAYARMTGAGGTIAALQPVWNILTFKIDGNSVTSSIYVVNFFFVQSR